MAVEAHPLFLNLDDVYQSRHLGVPFRDLLSEGVNLNDDQGDMSVAERGAGANMSVDIAGGSCWIAGDTNTATQPVYRLRNTGTLNVAISSNSSGLTRVDLVVARIRDSVFAGGSDSGAIEIVEGTPGSGAPTAPDSTLVLAEVTVVNGESAINTGDISDQRVAATVGGGTLDLNGDRPAARVFNSGGQSVGPTLNPVLFDSEDYDTDGMHSTSTNTGRLTAQTPGIYLVSFHGRLQAIDSGWWDTWISKNGSPVAYDRDAKSGATLELVSLSAQVELAANDYVEIGVSITGTAKNLERTSDYSPIFAAIWQRPLP